VRFPRGGVSVLLRTLAQVHNPARHLWLFDSFEGLPEPSAEDDLDAARFAAGRAQGRLASIGQCVGTVEEVERLLFHEFSLPRESVTIVKGWFQDTLRSYSGQPIALLHVDADWYGSVKRCLESLYRYVSPGGFVVADDYGHWEGARRAVDEFLQDLSPRPTLHRRGYTQAYFQRPG